MNIPDHPLEIIWDITYACPLRCVHCYSESGRRPSRQLRRADLLRMAEAIVAMKPFGISLAGGEPLLVKELFEVVGRMTDAGIKVALFTGGWTLRPEMLDDIKRGFFRVSVSVDGATAEVHDRVRGRRGSFDRAMGALAMLDGTGVDFGIDFVVVRSNFQQVEQVCTDVVPRFPGLRFVSFGAVVPEGLASRESFAERELLSDAQVATLGDPAYRERLRALVPPSVHVTATDNLALQMHPELLREGRCYPALQIEPDGEVRAMLAYEGTVGNLLTDSPAELWRRAVERWHDPFVVDALTPVRTMEQWAEATRKIDLHFGSAADRDRIARRPALT
ncbi:radical SAM protein [Nonomuraea rhizosphaerae]|uniref:radical SAM protein n=1 Tax=Nonomuraea rhizosphaerae TaxID=2665663 RepID=UPI001C5E98EB|nr:radical SAM protein [Nonomuraea rhizosphaerae]